MSVTTTRGNHTTNALLYSYLVAVIVADGQIHHEEMRILNQLLDEHEASPEERESVTLLLHNDGKAIYDLIEDLKVATPDIQSLALQQGLMVAYADGSVAPEEDELFRRCAVAWELPGNTYDKIKQEVEHLIGDPHQFRESVQRDALYVHLDHPMVHKLLHVIERSPLKRVATKARNLNNQILLAGHEYADAIQYAAKVAHANLSFVQPILQDNVMCLTQLSAKIGKVAERVRPSVDDTVDIKEVLLNLTNSLQDVTAKMIEESTTQLNKKRKAVSYFTISFMGKTKAGKSTLHAVITGEGKEGIGDGKQRTTRYNRVYTWEDIRIIDTPGIGAPGGKTDEEIAASIIDESDVICYVVKNDSIQESEFNFLHQLKEKNKPLIVLLNVKENLANPKRMELFLKDPERIYTRTDGKALGGHIERIRRHVLENYPNTHFDVIPVQLYAALLSRDEVHSSIADTLYNASHVQHFLDALKLSMIEEGPLRRSQTLLDGTAMALRNISTDIRQHAAVLSDIVQRLDAQRSNIAQKQETAYNRARRTLKSAVGEAFKTLQASVESFSQAHYNDREEEIKKAWERHVYELGVERELTAAVKSTIEEYVSEIKQYIEELVEDLSFTKLDSGDFTFHLQSTFSVQTVLGTLSAMSSLGGGILGVLEFFGISTGWGIPLLIAGFVVRWAKRLFKSKKAKIAEAVKNLSESIVKTIDEQQKKADQQAHQYLLAVYHKVDQSIETYYSAMTEATNTVVVSLNESEQMIATQADTVDKAYGWRILQAINARQSNDVALRQHEISSHVTEVERPDMHHLRIYTPVTVSDKSRKWLEETLQHKVDIVKP